MAPSGTLFLFGDLGWRDSRIKQQDLKLAKPPFMAINFDLSKAGSSDVTTVLARFRVATRLAAHSDRPSPNFFTFRPNTAQLCRLQPCKRYLAIIKVQE